MFFFLNLICKEIRKAINLSPVLIAIMFAIRFWDRFSRCQGSKSFKAIVSSHCFCAIKIVNVAGDGDEEEANGRRLKVVEMSNWEIPQSDYTLTLLRTINDWCFGKSWTA